MRRTVVLLTPLVLIGGVWFFWKHYRIEGLDQLVIRPRAASEDPVPDDLPPPQRGRQGVIRLATFGWPRRALGTAQETGEQVAALVRRFDLLALQDIPPDGPLGLAQLLQRVNALGGHYESLVAEPHGGSDEPGRLAFVFDGSSIQADRLSVYSIQDPQGLLERRPLVASFRVRGPAPDEAFTFTLINVHLDPSGAAREMEGLAEVYRAVRGASGGEDDIILLGDVGTPPDPNGPLGSPSGLRWLIHGPADGARQRPRLGNLLLSERATREFTGRSGLMEPEREPDLLALPLLGRAGTLPLWAEFRLKEMSIHRAVVGSAPDVAPAP